MDKKVLVDSFQHLDLNEVQSLIRQLRKVEQGLYTKEKCEEIKAEQLLGNPIYSKPFKHATVNGECEDTPTIFDSVPLLELDYLDNEPIESWLMPTPYKEGELRKLPLDEQDRSYIDSRLMSVRLRLLNYVRAALNEERADAVSSATLNVPVKLKRNASYVIRRDSEPSSPESPSLTPPSLSYASPASPPAPYVTLIGPTVYTPRGVPITLPVITDSNTTYTTSPPSALNTTLTYSAKRHGPYYHNGSPNTPYKNNAGSGANDLYTMFQDHSPIGLNTTFSTCPTIMNADTTIRLPNRVHVTPPRNLNSTFTQSPEDYGSNGSIHNSNMDEIHSLARMQEQSLHVSSTPRRLERRGTHTVARGSSLNEDGDEQGPQRKLSNDTYSLEESSPASGESSAISSPREGQSYENVQLASEAVRRSMPNLALIGSRKFSAIPAPPSQLRREPHYVSDQRIGRTRTRTLRAPTPGIHGQIRADSIEVSPVENTYIEARPFSANKPTYIRSNTFQKSNKALTLKKSEEDLYGRSRQTAAGEGSGMNFYSSRPSSIKPPSRPSALPAPRYTSQYREKEVSQQYPGIPRPRTEMTRGSMLPTSMYSVPGSTFGRPDTSRY